MSFLSNAVKLRCVSLLKPQLSVLRSRLPPPPPFRCRHQRGKPLAPTPCSQIISRAAGASAVVLPSRQAWVKSLVPVTGPGEDASPAAQIMQLDGRVFGAAPRLDVLHRVIVFHRRELWGTGTGSAKNRSEVRGGGKKPWRQKGTGRARVASTRNPIWRGGGVSHGPRPRDHRIRLPAKVQSLGLRVALSVKYGQGDLIIVDDLEPSTNKTKGLKNQIERLGAESSALFVDVVAPQAFLRAVRNIPDVDYVDIDELSVFAMLKRHTLVITRAAVTALETRLTREAAGGSVNTTPLPKYV